MEWKVKKVKQETSHSFLNFVTVTYDVTKLDGNHYDYEYFMATRHDKDHILPVAKSAREVNIDHRSFLSKELVSQAENREIRADGDENGRGWLDEHSDVIDKGIR